MSFLSFPFNLFILLSCVLQFFYPTPTIIAPVLSLLTLNLYKYSFEIMTVCDTMFALGFTDVLHFGNLPHEPGWDWLYEELVIQNV